MKRLDPYPVLEARIRTGVYPTGSWLTPERQLAEELGVHRQTIRRAVERLSQAGLLDRKPGHRPVIRGSGAPITSGNTVALLMGADPIFQPFQQVLRGCERELGSLGYRMVFMDTMGRDSASTREREFRALDSLLEHPVTGLVIWCQAPVASLPRLEQLRATGMPIVALDRFIRHLDADFVAVDNFSAAAHAVDHLSELGHERIGLITLPETSTSVIDRETGFRAALDRRGLQLDESNVFRLPEAPASGEDDYEKIARSIFGNANRPTAVFAVNDVLAWRLLSVVCAGGKRVPEDLAIVGFDDLEGWAMHKPVLTTIRLPYEDIGRHAASLLLQRLKTPEAAIRHLLLDTSLVVRSSTVGDTEDVSTTLRSAWSPAVLMPQRAGVSTALR